MRRIWSRVVPGVAIALLPALLTGVPRAPAASEARGAPARHTTALDRIGFAGTLPAAAPAGAGRAGPPPDAADARACGGLPVFAPGTAAEIMAGRLTIAPFKAVTIDPNRDGDVDWSMNPDGDPTWVLDFQTGTWMEALVEAYQAGGKHAAAYRDRLKALLTGWLNGVPIASQNPETLMCAAEAFPGQGWIHDKIPGLLDYYAANWQGAYNHGLSQDLELLRAGCAYSATEWGGQPLGWRQLARQQLIESFQPNQYGPAVDAQGVTNEQSTGYANFDYGLWAEAEGDLAACRQPPLPAPDRAAIARMPLFLALATQPDGRLVQIGDTYAVGPRNRPGTPLQFAASRGTSGTPPPHAAFPRGAPEAPRVLRAGFLGLRGSGGGRRRRRASAALERRPPEAGGR